MKSNTVSTAVSVLAALSVLACTPERLRPGPPVVTIQVPVGSTVFSPDTLSLRVIAQDPNGLDSLNVSLLDSIVEVNTQFRPEADEFLDFPIPAGLDEGTVLTVTARATDLTGSGTTERATVTVVARPPNARTEN